MLDGFKGSSLTTDKKGNPMSNKSTMTVMAFACALLASGNAMAGKLAPLDKIQDRTADALGLDADEFTVSDLEKDGVSTRYVVTTKKGEKYKCYVTSTSGLTGFMSGGASVSDAICNKGNEVGKKNPFLEAAEKSK